MALILGGLHLKFGGCCTSELNSRARLAVKLAGHGHKNRIYFSDVILEARSQLSSLLHGR